MSIAKKAGFEAYVAFKPSPDMLAKIHEVVEECTKKYVDKQLEPVLKKILDEKLEEIVRKYLEEKGKGVEGLRDISPRVVVIEEIPKEEAKLRVEEYFKEHKTADIEELMLNLKIPVQTLVEIIDELKQAGKISPEDEEKI